MGRKKKDPRQKLLTDVELEIMQALWGPGEATVKEVQDALPKDRALAYTSVATILTILEKKKMATHRRGDRALVFRPLVSRADYEGRSVRHLVERVFQGAPSAAVLRLLGDSQFSEEELRSIRLLLEERSRQ